MKLFGKLILLVVLIWAINLAVFRALKLPLLWGVYYERQAYYEANAEHINTVFFGSSLSHRQINSLLFDSLNCAQGAYTSSFNYGYDASTLPEIYTTFKNVLDNKPDTLKTVIVELAPLRNFEMIQLHSLRRKSFDNFCQSFYSVWLSISSNSPITDRLVFLWLNTVNLVEAEFHVGLLEDAYKFKIYQNQYKIPRERNDFEPVETNNDNKEVVYMGKKFRNPHTAFLENQLEYFGSNTEKVRALFANISVYKKAERNAGYEALVFKMMSMAKEKKVRLIFLLPPRLKEIDYRDVIPVYLALPPANRIELADPNRYPEFYTIESSFDLAHLAKPATNVYSTRLHTKYLELMGR